MKMRLSTSALINISIDHVYLHTYLIIVLHVKHQLQISFVLLHSFLSIPFPFSSPNMENNQKDKKKRKYRKFSTNKKIFLNNPWNQLFCFCYKPSLIFNFWTLSIFANISSIYIKSRKDLERERWKSSNIIILEGLGFDTCQFS